MNVLLRLSRIIDAANQYLGQLTAWAIVVAIFIATANAISRRFIGVSSNAWLEMQWYLFGAVVMLCAAWALRDDAHVRIDIVASQLTRRWRNWLDLFGLVVFVLPFVAMMSWLLGTYAQTSLLSQEVSINPGGLIIWPIKAIILVGFVSLLGQTVSQIIKRIAVITGHLEESPELASNASSENGSAPHTSQ